MTLFPSGLLVLLIFGVLICPVHAQFNHSDGIPSTVLREQDKKLSRGQVKYFQLTTNRSDPVKLPPNLPIGRDKFPDEDKPVRVTNATVLLTFTPDKFVRQTFSPKHGDVLKEVFDGEDFMVKSDSEEKGVSNFTTLKKGTKEQSEDERKINLYPGPCAVQGRGLSFLHNYRIIGTEREPVLECHLSPETPDTDIILTAYLDPQKGFLAKRIEWHSKKVLVNRFILSNPRRLNNGVWIAGESHQESIFGDGPPRFERRTKVISARMFEPKDDVFQINVTQGMLVEDSTSGTKTVLRKTSPGSISKEQFISLSRQHQEQEAHIMARAEVIRRDRLIKRLLSNGAWAVVFASLLGITVVLLRRRKGKEL